MNTEMQHCNQSVKWLDCDQHDDCYLYKCLKCDYQSLADCEDQQ